jgi:hypothetical protein
MGPIQMALDLGWRDSDHALLATDALEESVDHQTKGLQIGVVKELRSVLQVVKLVTTHATRCRCFPQTLATHLMVQNPW